MILNKLWNSRTFRLTGGVIIFLIAFGIAYLTMMDKNSDKTQVYSITHNANGCELTLQVGYEYITVNESNVELCQKLKAGDHIII